MLLYQFMKLNQSTIRLQRLFLLGYLVDASLRIRQTKHRRDNVALLTGFKIC